MRGSDRRAGILAAAVLVAGVLFALAGERLRSRGDGTGFSRGPASAGVTPAEGAAWRELAPASLGSRDLQGVAVAPDGLVAVVVGSDLAWLGPDGGLARRAPLPGPAFCLAVTADRVFVCLRDRVAVLDRSGAVISTWEGLGERAWLTSIAVRGEDVLVADAGNRLVWRFATGGRLRGQLGRRDAAAGEEGFVVPSPFFDVAFGPAGELWVVNPGEHRVERRGLDGRAFSAWGRAAAGPEGFSGCCNPSHLALLADGSFVTSEKGTPRVTLHDRDGRFAEVIEGPDAFAPRALDLDIAVDAQGRVLVLDPLRGQLRFFARAAAGSAGGRRGR
jgi:hypothetical protein